MPDVDLAAILAPGDYLKREDDQLVGAHAATGWYVQALKVDTENGYGTPELKINGLTSVTTAQANRYTRVAYRIMVPAINTAPTVATYGMFRLRYGNGTTGAVIDSHLWPLVPGMQNYGANGPMFWGDFSAFKFSPSIQICLTFQSGSGNYSIGPGTSLNLYDVGS